MCPDEATRDGLECVTVDLTSRRYTPCVGEDHVPREASADPIGVYHILQLELSRAHPIQAGGICFSYSESY